MNKVLTRRTIAAILQGHATERRTWSHVKGTVYWADGGETLLGTPDKIEAHGTELHLRWKLKRTGTIVEVEVGEFASRQNVVVAANHDEAWVDQKILFS